MSLFYQLAYRIGVTPWEAAGNHAPATRHVAALLDREGEERDSQLGAALDLGCGSGRWAVDLARRGWRVTAVDNVARAVARARAAADAAGVAVRVLRCDVTALAAAGVGRGFDFFFDFGTLHGLAPAERITAGREITAAAAPDATLLTLSWSPGRRGPLPRGASRADIEAAFPDWTVIDAAPFDVTGLPAPLRGVAPYVYRLRHRGAPPPIR